ncbi:MAG: membrane protein insertion efficiency factor YidD [Solitalea-like symbiont of Tyrophagus putrescentiae]
MINIIKFILIKFIRLYQIIISPLLPISCRFYPSCSEYAKLAIIKHGIIKGCYLALVRLLKCNSLFKGGIDNVK